jgi:hypothetical protein
MVISPWFEVILLQFNHFDVVASLAAIGLQLRIAADARGGLNQPHLLAAAKARDWTPWLIFWLFGSHGENVTLKSICISIPDFSVVQRNRYRSKAQKRPQTDFINTIDLSRMRLAFYGFDASYHVARWRFITREPIARTPLHLARHRLPNVPKT